MISEDEALRRRRLSCNPELQEWEEEDFAG
jgi:hypothetical protein